MEAITSRLECLFLHSYDTYIPSGAVLPSHSVPGVGLDLSSGLATLLERILVAPFVASMLLVAMPGAPSSEHCS